LEGGNDVENEGQEMDHANADAVAAAGHGGTVKRTPKQLPAVVSSTRLLADHIIRLSFDDEEHDQTWQQQQEHQHSRKTIAELLREEQQKLDLRYRERMQARHERIMSSGNQNAAPVYSVIRASVSQSPAPNASSSSSGGQRRGRANSQHSVDEDGLQRATSSGVARGRPSGPVRNSARTSRAATGVSVPSKLVSASQSTSVSELDEQLEVESAVQKVKKPASAHGSPAKHQSPSKNSSGSASSSPKVHSKQLKLSSSSNSKTASASAVSSSTLPATAYAVLKSGSAPVPVHVLEDGSVVPIKRKRGRPRKHPEIDASMIMNVVQARMDDVAEKAGVGRPPKKATSS
jgi:hypothetical protein